MAYHVPGHTPGSLCYHFGYFLFTGDSLMCNQIGATSDAASKCKQNTGVMCREQLKKSIKEKLFVLPKETMVLPGSGSFTSIATEATAIDAQVNEMITKFFLGQESLDKWDEYVAELNSMGLEHVLEVEQAVYDRYLAR